MKYAADDVNRILNEAHWDVINNRVILDDSEDDLPDGVYTELDNLQDLEVSLELIVECSVPAAVEFNDEIPDIENYSNDIVRQVLTLHQDNIRAIGWEEE